MLQLQPDPDISLCEVNPLADQIEAVERSLMQAVVRGELTELECPVTHYFQPGVYIRELEMPAGAIVIGNEHRTTHLNICVSGCALVSIGGHIMKLEAPHTFMSEAGVRKVLLIFETMKFITVHANPENETDIEKLEARLIKHSQTYEEFAQDIRALRTWDSDFQQKLFVDTLQPTHDEQPRQVPTLP